MIADLNYCLGASTGGVSGTGLGVGTAGISSTIGAGVGRGSMMGGTGGAISGCTGTTRLVDAGARKTLLAAAGAGFAAGVVLELTELFGSKFFVVGAKTEGDMLAASDSGNVRSDSGAGVGACNDVEAGGVDLTMRSGL